MKQTPMMHTRRAQTCLPCVMGCSKSKEQKERSSEVERKEAWETAQSKGLGLSKLDSNMKRLDTGYIASIFSTNYNTALRRAPLNTKLDVDELLLPHSLPCTEGSALKNISKFKLGHGRARTSSLSDMTLMQPLLSNGNEEASTGQKVGGDAEVEVDASNSPYLDDTGVFLKVGSLSKMHPEAAPLMDPIIKASQAEAPHSVSMLKRAVTFSRAKYLTFFDDTEDIDALIAATKSSASENVLAVHDSSNEVVKPNLHTHHQYDGVSFESSGGNTYRQICNESNAEPVSLWEATLDTEIHPWSQTSTINSYDSLSMKYILNDNSIENEEPHTLPDSYAISELCMLHSRVHDEDNDEVGFWYESNCSSCLSSPEFSSAASLKDWLPSEDPPLMLAADFYRAGKQTPIFDSLEAAHMILGPDLLPSTKRVLMKYVGGNSSCSLDDATQDIFQSPLQAAEKDGVPTLMMAQRGSLCI